MFSRLRANLPIMFTFFNSPKEAGTEVPADQNKDNTATTAPPTLATHNALSSDADVLTRKETSSKPSSEKESTLVDEPIRDSTVAEDTNKETTANEDSNKESVPKNDTEKETAKDEDKSGSDDDADQAKEPEPEYPTALRLLLITIALCLCVFCVALVRHLLAISNMIILGRSCLQYLEIVCIGQHNHCNGHPQDNRSIQLPWRCRLVR